MKAIVAGGTGLVGSFLIKTLEAHPAFDEVRAFTRRTREGASSKVQWLKIDLDDQSALNDACVGAQVAFCALGTTIKTAGSQDAFRKVDYEYVVQFAQAAKKAGVKQFHVVSAIGASAKSGIFYSRVKGEMEEALNGLGFDGLYIYRPSFLEGPRQEKRVGEQIGGGFMKLFSPLFLGKAEVYKPIHVRDVAQAMVGAALKQQSGIHVHTWKEMLALSATLRN